jgi:hypothetical protein
VKVEEALGARKLDEAGTCDGTRDLDLTLATIRQAQPGATLDEIPLRRWILESPHHEGSGPGMAPPDSMMQSPSTSAAPWLIAALPW